MNPIMNSSTMPHNASASPLSSHAVQYQQNLRLPGIPVVPLRADPQIQVNVDNPRSQISQKRRRINSSSQANEQYICQSVILSGQNAQQNPYSSTRSVLQPRVDSEPQRMLTTLPSSPITHMIPQRNTRQFRGLARPEMPVMQQAGSFTVTNPTRQEVSQRQFNSMPHPLSLAAPQSTSPSPIAQLLPKYPLNSIQEQFGIDAYTMSTSSLNRPAAHSPHESSLLESMQNELAEVRKTSENMLRERDEYLKLKDIDIESLQKELANVRDTSSDMLSDKDNDLTSRDAEIESLRRIVQERDDELQDVKRAAEKDLRIRESEIGKLRKEMLDIKGKVKSKTEENGQLVKQCEALSSQVKASENRYEAMHAEFQSTQARMKKARESQSESHQEAVERLNRDKEKLVNYVNGVHQQNADLLAEVSKYDKLGIRSVGLENILTGVNAVLEENERLKNDVNVQQNQTASMAGVVQDLVEKLQSAQDDAKYSRQEAATYKLSIEVNKLDLEGIARQLEGAEAEICRLKSGRASLANELDTKNDEISVLEKEQKRLEEENAKLNDSIGIAQREREQLKTEIESLQSALTTRHREFEAAEAKATESQAHSDALVDHLRRVESKLLEATQISAIFLEAADGAIEELKGENNSWQSEIAELKIEVEELESGEDHEEEVCRLKTEIQGLFDQVKKTRKRLEQGAMISKNFVRMADDTVDALRSENQDLRHQVNDYRERLQDGERRLTAQETEHKHNVAGLVLAHEEALQRRMSDIGQKLCRNLEEIK